MRLRQSQAWIKWEGAFFRSYSRYKFYKKIVMSAYIEIDFSNILLSTITDLLVMGNKSLNGEILDSSFLQILHFFISFPATWLYWVPYDIIKYIILVPLHSDALMKKKKKISVLTSKDNHNYKKFALYQSENITDLEKSIPTIIITAVQTCRLWMRAIDQLQKLPVSRINTP